MNPRAPWIKQQGESGGVAAGKPRAVGAFEEQRGTEGSVIGVDSHLCGGGGGPVGFAQTSF